MGMHAAGRGGAELGKTALIIGVGTIGYMTMLACKAMGVSKIIVSDALENIGVDFDEKAAAKYPAIDMDFSWLFSRLEDGTAVRP